jgi:hypothetical protein
MRLVPVEQVAASIRAIDDPVLRGKIHKALHMLHRTLELYKYAIYILFSCAGRSLAGASVLYMCQQCSNRTTDYSSI